MSEYILGIIGGSGLYQFDGLTDIKSEEIDTPFGKPTSKILSGKINGKKVVFLSRHGQGHIFNPSEVNYRANIYALKSLGIKKVVSVSACGSLQEEFKPGDIVIPDQIVDFTKGFRKNSFFENGLVVHVGTADPYCSELSQSVLKAVKKTDHPVHHGGKFIVIEGPRFSTKAESELFRSWGMSIIGMTAAPEAFLAKEAEMCYATMAHVTDYDVWHQEEESVSVEMVVKTFKNNLAAAQNAIVNLVDMMPEEEYCSCHESLKGAVITNPGKIPSNTADKLSLLVGKYINK